MTNCGLFYNVVIVFSNKLVESFRDETEMFEIIFETLFARMGDVKKGQAIKHINHLKINT